MIDPFLKRLAHKLPRLNWTHCRPSFCASPFTDLFLIRKRKHVAGLTLKRLTKLLQGIEIDPERLALFQAPQRRVADACLFGQPIEGPTVLFQ